MLNAVTPQKWLYSQCGAGGASMPMAVSQDALWHWYPGYTGPQAVGLDAWLAKNPLPTWADPASVHDIFISFGPNDLGLPYFAEDIATWKTQYGTLIDMLHSRYPAARIYLSRI